MAGRQIDHDKFVVSNRMLAIAEAADKLDRQGTSDSHGQPIKKTCSNCNRKKHCKKNKVVIRGGSASIGSEDAGKNTCEEWTEMKSGAMSNRQQKNLLKSFKKKMRR